MGAVGAVGAPSEEGGVDAAAPGALGEAGVGATRDDVSAELPGVLVDDALLAAVPELGVVSMRRRS